MAIPREPRQRMINIMYLVLIALLALNVSAEVLKAFGDMNTSLEESTKGLNAKIDGIKSDFSVQMSIDPQKTKQYNDKAIEVGKESSDLYAWIENLKQEMIKQADGIDEETQRIVNDRDTDISSRMMLPENEGKGVDLKKKMKSLEELIQNAKQEFGLGSQVDISKLSTADEKTNDGMKKWEVATFNSLPVVAAVARLSQIQNDIKSIEATVLGELLSKINQETYKFDKLETLVIPKKSNILTKGQDFEADIFLSAYNSTTKPKIRIGKLKPEIQADSNGNFGSYGESPLSEVENDTLPIDRGKGHYVIPNVNALGETVKEGCIEVPDPNTGAPVYWPFRFTYTVNKSSVVVSADKMNVLYIGVKNPLSISVPGYASSEISASISSGSLSGKKGKYDAIVRKPGKANITVFAQEEGGKKKLGSSEFRVKRVPDPVATLGGKHKGGRIKTAVFKAQGGIIPILENFDFDLNFKVQSFEVIYTLPRQDAQIFKGKSAAFNGSMKDAFKRAKPKTQIFFTDIKVKGPDGSTRKLPSISFVCT